MTEARPALIRKGTTVDDMLKILSQEIIDGAHKPGSRLHASALADRFGVSRTPVRETLSQLCAMGLGEKRPNRGVIVTRVSAGYLEGMFEAMAELEAACARLCALRMTLNERAQLKNMHESALSLVRNGSPADEYERFNHDFHTLLYTGSHSPYLQDLATATRGRLQPFRRAQFNMNNRTSNSWEEHNDIVKAILASDGDAAASATRMHVFEVRVSSQTYVEDHQHKD